MRCFGAIAAVLGLMLGAGQGQAADLKMLSAGALEPAMVAAAKAFHDKTGDTVTIDFATATIIQERAGAPLPVELVAGPDPLMDQLAKAGRILPNPSPLGRIGVGVTVRKGAPIPDISTPETLKAALLGAKVVVYNRASSGVSVEGMMQKMGVADALAARTQRFPDAESVMKHVIAGGTDEIGFGAVTAIGLYTENGLRRPAKSLILVGPVPAALQNYTYYVVAPTPAAGPLAKKFIAFLGTPEARALMTATGVGPR